MEADTIHQFFIKERDNEPPFSLSRMFWNIDWNTAAEDFRHKDYKIRYSPGVIALNFVRTHFSAELNDSTYPESQAALINKQKFYNHFSDFFLVLNAENEIVSAMIGNPTDWSSYYIRFCATLPQYRRTGAQSIVVDLLKSELVKKGVERIMFEFSPVNQSQVNYLNQNHFYITGNAQSDRWGQLIQTTCFLSKNSEDAFKSKFGTTFISKFERVVEA